LAREVFQIAVETGGLEVTADRQLILDDTPRGSTDTADWRWPPDASSELQICISDDATSPDTRLLLAAAAVTSPEAAVTSPIPHEIGDRYRQTRSHHNTSQ